MSNPEESPKSPLKDALRALRNLAIAAVVLLGLFAAYHKYVANSRVIDSFDKQAKDLILSDNPPQYVAAMKLLQKSLAIRSDDPYALGAGAEAAAVLWTEYGVDSYEKLAVDLDRRADKAELNTREQFLADALVGVAQGHAAPIEAKMTDLTKKGVAPAEVVAALGLVHATEGKLEDARNDYKQAADRAYRGARYYGLYGDALYDMGDFADASTAYQRALDSNPIHLRSLIGKARADVAQNQRVDDAMNRIDDLLAKGPDELPPVMKARALAAKSEALLAAGNAVDAEAAARQAIQAEVASDPERAYAHYDLGLALAMEKKAGALQAFQDAIHANGAIARFYFQGALALAEAGDTSDGKTLIDGYRAKKDDAYQVALGDYFAATGDVDQALSAYTAATKLSDVNPVAWYKEGYTLQRQALKLSRVKQRLKLYTQAQKAFEKAVAIRDAYPEVYRQMGLIYLDLDPHSGDALDSFGKALKYYKELKASKETVAAFIAEVAARYKRARQPALAREWTKEANMMMH